MDRFDIAVIGAGPAGAATALRAAQAGVRVGVFEKGSPGRDKACGDCLTPRAVSALADLSVSLTDAHRIDGLRMIAGDTRRELPWPDGRFGPHGAMWPRRMLDLHLAEAAAEAGAEISWDTEVLPWLDDEGSVVGVRAARDAARWRADLVVLAAGAQGEAARMLGAQRVADEPFGLAIRTYAESPRHDDRSIEACLTLRGADERWLPGYGWMFPAGDGTVNVGVGAMSTMKNFRKLNLNRLLEGYRAQVAADWHLGDWLERPRAWRLPMSTVRRWGPGWAAVGDAAGLVNPMNGEGIDYGLESGMLLADRFTADPATAAQAYDREIGERFDGFLRTGRRFGFLIGHPWILRNGLRVAVGSQAVANITLQVMGNLIDGDSRGVASRVLGIADRGLELADPLLRRTRAAA